MRRALPIFLAFAHVDLIAALLQAVTAMLAPVVRVEMGLGAVQLGLLAGV